MNHKEFMEIQSEENGTIVLHAMCCSVHQKHRPVLTARTVINLSLFPDIDTNSELAYVIIDDCANLLLRSILPEAL